MYVQAITPEAAKTFRCETLVLLETPRGILTHSAGNVLDLTKGMGRVDRLLRLCAYINAKIGLMKMYPVKRLGSLF